MYGFLKPDMQEWRAEVIQEQIKEEGINTWLPIHMQQKSAASKTQKPDYTGQLAYIPVAWHGEKRKVQTDLCYKMPMLTGRETLASVCWAAQSCLTLHDRMDYSPPGSSVYGIFQARVLEWVAICFSRGSSQLRDRTHVSCTAGGFFTTEHPGKPPWYLSPSLFPTVKVAKGHTY